VSYDKKYCQWIDEKTFDLLKCEKYTIFNLLLKINYEILNIFSYFYKSITQKNIIEKETFQFYYKFVKSNTKVLGNQIELEKPHVKKILKRSRRKIKSQSNRLPKLDETSLGSESNLVNPELSLMSSLGSSRSLVSGSPVSMSPRISISTLANNT
jgi:hypothetical protein